MADVFISYHEKSAGGLAQRIADALDRAGISSWCARRDLPPGSDFARDIPPQIDACRVFLLILNNNVYQSLDVENELGMAFERLKKQEAITILPFETEDVSREGWLRYYLFHIQSVKIPPSDPQRVEKLIGEIARILGVTPRKPQPATPPYIPTPQAQSVPDPYIPTPQAQPAQLSAKIIEHGKCGDNVTYTLDENGVLTISGIGAMQDYYYDTMPWYQKRKVISSVCIQDGVISIGSWAFSGCKNSTNVTISNSVISIGANAFWACRNLTSVDIPDSVVFIESNAFKGCDNLKSVSVSRKAKIRQNAFPNTEVIRYP